MYVFPSFDFFAEVEASFFLILSFYTALILVFTCRFPDFRHFTFLFFCLIVQLESYSGTSLGSHVCLYFCCVKFFVLCFFLFVPAWYLEFFIPASLGFFVFSWFFLILSSVLSLLFRLSRNCWFYQSVWYCPQHSSLSMDPNSVSILKLNCGILPFYIVVIFYYHFSSSLVLDIFVRSLSWITNLFHPIIHVDLSEGVLCNIVLAHDWFHSVVSYCWVGYFCAVHESRNCSTFSKC